MIHFAQSNVKLADCSIRVAGNSRICASCGFAANPVKHLSNKFGFL